jgi:hypothetical protein
MAPQKIHITAGVDAIFYGHPKNGIESAAP